MPTIESSQEPTLAVVGLPSVESASARSQGVQISIVALLVGIIAGMAAIAPINPFDGGISASAATFTLHGQLPYRDYWLLYGPLSGWLFAVPLALLGPSTALIMTTGVLTLVVAGVAAFVFADGHPGTRLGVVVAVASVVMVAPFHGVEFSAWPLAMALALGGHAAAQRGRTGLAGVLLGLAFLSRFDVGGYAMVAALVWPRRLQLIASFAAIAGPVVALALLTTPFSRLFEQVIWWPLIGNRVYRGLASPELASGGAGTLIALVQVILPRAAIVASVAVLASRRGSRSLAALTIFAALCQLQTLGRPDPAHFVQAATPGLLLIAFLVDWRSRASRLTSLVAVAAALGFGLTSLVFWISPPDRTGDQALENVATIVQNATARDEPLYVGVTDHRFTIANNLVGYYLADRRPGTRTTMFNPGITNTDARQAEMAQELEASGTAVLLLDERYLPLESETAGSTLPGSDTLNQYIAAQFEVVCQVGPIVLMERRGQDILACP